MQVRAVVKLAVLRMRLEVGHEVGELHRLNVVQSELLKARRVYKRGLPGFIYPVKRGAGRGVFARVQSLRDLCSQDFCLRHQ